MSMIRSFLKTGGGGKSIEQVYGGSNDKNDRPGDDGTLRSV